MRCACTPKAREPVSSTTPRTWPPASSARCWVTTASPSRCARRSRSPAVWVPPLRWSRPPRRAAGADDPFAIAAAYDGHPENAAASVFGGLLAATTVEGIAVARAAGPRRGPRLRRPGARPRPGHPTKPGACSPTRSAAATRSSISAAWACWSAGLADPAHLRCRRHRGPHPPAGPHGPVPRGARTARRPRRGRRAGRLLVGCRADPHRLRHPRSPGAGARRCARLRWPRRACRDG